jgi:hypothetical protein
MKTMTPDFFFRSFTVIKESNSAQHTPHTRQSVAAIKLGGRLPLTERFQHAYESVALRADATWVAAAMSRR